MMKKNLLRLWILTLLCAVLLSCGLAACSKEPTPDGEQQDPPADVEALVLVDEATGAGLYAVVRPEITERRLIDQAAALRNKLINHFGVEKWEIQTDWEKDPDPAEIAERYEILVGKTNRPESEQVHASLGQDQYAIRVVNNKLVIVGVDDMRTVMAVKYFIDTYLSEDAPAIPKALDVLTTAVYTAQSTKDGPIIVNTQYTTEDVVIADIYLSEEDYGIDPTGTDDASNIIQKALNDCQAKGGGTVYLPAGKYRITKNINIPSCVCLRGDWQDPDAGDEYGTVIIADVKSATSTSEGLFNISGSSGVHGMTVYYPNQSVEDPKPYPPTFFVRAASSQGFMAYTVANVTVINGYEGIRTHRENGHEQLTVENFKGTFLSIGLYLTNSSDVGTCTNITVRPTYWPAFARAMGYTVPDEAALKKYTRANATGFVIGDLEWTEFIHITVSDCKRGIHIIDGARISFAGSFYDTVIMDTDIALQADDMDVRWGMQISNSYLVGSENAIVNNSDAVIKTAGTTAKGGLIGTVLVDTDNLTQYKVDTGRSYKKPVEKLYMSDSIEKYKTGKTDVSGMLQALLDEAGKTGGVVYLPGGIYLLEKPITVPSGVELRGCLPIANRCQSGMSKGTIFHVTYGLGGDEDDVAAVTLEPSSGINGIRLQSWENRGSTRETAYMVRGLGKDVYMVYCSFLAAGRGVDFFACDNHLIKKLTTFCYINDIRVGGDNGYIVGMLHNGNMIDRHGLPGVSYPVTAGYASENHVAREYNATIIVDDAKNQTIYNSFAYGVRNLIHSVDSENTLAVNIGADNIGDTSPLLLVEGGSFVGINIMRYNGVSCEYTDDTSLRLYSRLAIGERREETLIVE
ncbi:MAG: hypothetical protein IJY66_02015 [Clostridia bacterium]|nr:hypothetical protein [Clostridia bacterium]